MKLFIVFGHMALNPDFVVMVQLLFCNSQVGHLQSPSLQVGGEVISNVVKLMQYFTPLSHKISDPSWQLAQRSFATCKLSSASQTIQSPHTGGPLPISKFPEFRLMHNKFCPSQIASYPGCGQIAV